VTAENSGRRAIVDDFTREAPAIAVDFSLPGRTRGARPRAPGGNARAPKAIVCDNAPEFTGGTLDHGRTRAAWRSSSFNPASRF
jgi:hypothetical protein